MGSDQHPQAAESTVGTGTVTYCPCYTDEVRLATNGLPKVASLTVMMGSGDHGCAMPLPDSVQLDSCEAIESPNDERALFLAHALSCLCLRQHSQLEPELFEQAGGGRIYSCIARFL